MAIFYDYDATTLEGGKSKIYINSGPVIQDKDGKFLLHQSASGGTWQFTGGRLDDDFSPKANAQYRPAQDLGIEILIRHDVEPFVVYGTIMKNGAQAEIVLIHYQATIQSDQQLRGEHKWFSLDEVRQLDTDGKTSSRNVLLACEYFSK